MSGHIVFKSDFKDFEMSVEKLMKHQRISFKTMGPAFKDFAEFINELRYELGWKIYSIA